MTIEQKAYELSELITQSDALEARIDELRESMAMEMDYEGISRYNHNGFVFNKINGRIENRVDHREFYEMAVQHEGISEMILTELTSSCIRDRSVRASLSIRRPRNGE